MSDQYHHQVLIELGCGCRLEHRLPLVSGLEPSGETTVLALIETFSMDTVLTICASDSHQERGQEKLTVTVRTKVGPVPEQLPEGGW